MNLSLPTPLAPYVGEEGGGGGGVGVGKRAKSGNKNTLEKKYIYIARKLKLQECS